jgi:hypothetical protein
LLLENPLEEYQDNKNLSANGTQKGTVWQVFLIEDYSGYSYLNNFFVTSEQTNSVKVVEGRFVKGGTLLSGYKEIEIPKSKLLLWKDCLVEKDVVVDEYRADFPKKAMVINRLIGTNVEQNPGYYKAPNTEDRFRIGLPKEFTVLFVYKVQNNCMLLGTKPRVEDPQNAISMIKGWAPFSQLTPWNHHLALEFNWEKADVRKGNQTPIMLYDNAVSAPNFCSNKNFQPASAVGRTVFREQTFHTQRVQGFYTRTPVLTQGIELSNRTPEIGFIGEIKLQSIPGMENCIDQIDPPLNALDEIRIKTQINVKKSSRINILFVVDGTKSMERYSSSIQMAMTTTMNSLKQEYGKDDRISFNFGAAVYRDHLENSADCPGIGGNYVVDISNNGNWTTNITSINEFFAGSMVVERNKCDREHPEAVYYGLSKAMKTFSVDKMNTNYIILIGDASNNDAYWSSSVSQQSVIQLMVENNFNLIALQVHHVNDPSNNAFNLFRTQCQDIIRGIALQKNRNLHSNYDIFRNQYSNCSSFWDRFYERFPTGDIQLRHVGNTVDINPEECPIIARFTPSPDNDSLSVKELKVLLDTALTKIAVDNDKWIRSVWLGDISNISYMNQLAYFYLLKCGLQFSEVELRSGKTDKVTHKDAMTYIFLNKQVYEKAYTCYQPNWSDDPLFQYVAFLGQIHLARSRDFFSKTLVTPMPQITPLRNAIYNIWYQILCTQLGICNDHKEFSNMSIGECMAYVTGLPAPERFRSLYVRDLTNPTNMADSAIYGLCVDFIYAFLHVESLLSNQNKLTSASFRNYESYILQYLKSKGIDLPPGVKRNVFFQRLGQMHSSYGSLYALDNNGNSKYPNVCIDINNPNNPFNYYYWVDTRIFPSKIARGSDIILRVARGN